MAAFRVMGILNVTPDSFSDGGEWLDAGAAVAHGRDMAAEGAELIDVGGESTRPRAEPVSPEEELRRVLPVVEALAAGAGFVNDVTALRGDPQMAAVVAEAGCECCLMHMLGEPRTMQDDPRYGDVVDDVRAFLEERVAFAVASGIAPARIHVDPGIGFGKTGAHNLELLRRLDEIAAIGFPVVVGTSRKSFLGRLTGRTDPHDRVAGTVATSVLAFERGARVFRVHDVAPTVDALKVAAATLTGHAP
ncbi:MAG TPA: dihydropteroate synthase [Solirubrobacteraceae bacterium]|nr:dihydropteroate synthase [Solirubrobacteraceae bacterium]